jgi:hypothetical protein
MRPKRTPDNANIQKTLAGIRADLDHDAIVATMIAANVPAEFINQAERGNARFNVYAAEKVANVARVLAGAGRLNHYTRAIVASAYRCAAAGLPFTHADAVAACSLEVKADPAKPLVRYEKHVAPNTASTQASSSIAALKTFGVLTEGKTPSGAVAYGYQVNPTSDGLLAHI